MLQGLESHWHHQEVPVVFFWLLVVFSEFIFSLAAFVFGLAGVVAAVAALSSFLNSPLIFPAWLFRVSVFSPSVAIASDNVALFKDKEENCAFRAPPFTFWASSVTALVSVSKVLFFWPSSMPLRALALIFKAFFSVFEHLLCHLGLLVGLLLTLNHARSLTYHPCY